MATIKNIIDNIQKNNFDKALNLCDLIENETNKHIISNIRGFTYFKMGKLDLAEKNFLISSDYNKKYIEPVKNIYSLYIQRKKFKLALEEAKKLVALDKNNLIFIAQLGYAYEVNFEFNNAISQYEKVLFLNNKDKKIYNQLGYLYQIKKQSKKALEYFLQGYRLDNNDKLITNNILMSYIKLADVKNSEIFLEKACLLDDKYSDYIFNKAEYLILKGHMDEAVELLDENKDNIKFLIRLIRLYFYLGKKNEGYDLLNKNIDKINKNPENYNLIALRYLQKGNFNEGWKYYTLKNPYNEDFFTNIKEWNGEKLEGRTIVVYNEQGLGDSVQFSKYILPLVKVSKKVSFAVQKNIKNLFKQDIEGLEVIKRVTVSNHNYDFKISLGSLLKFYYNHKFSSNKHLININDKKILKLENKSYNLKPNIGLVWSGTSRDRSVPLNRFENILNLNANFYCLQNKIEDSDQNYFKSKNIYNLGKYKLDDISSIVNELDLVITIDTSILHISCAIGKETWGLFSVDPDWRWGEFDKINPYKTLIKFNQKNYNNWEYVLENVFNELKKRL